MDSISLTIVSMETNDAINLFSPKGWDQQGYDAQRLLGQLQQRNLHLSITELSLAETFVGNPEGQRQRFHRMKEFADLAGATWFSIGANMRWVIDREQTFSHPTEEDRLVRWDADAQAALFDRLAGSPEAFHQWHAEAVMDTARWLDPDTWHAKDQQVRAAYANDPSFADPSKAEEWLDGAIATIPDRLYDSWMLELLVPDDQLRARVAREPQRCPMLVALGAVGMLNGYGAITNAEKGWARYGWLATARNNWTDARLLAEAAYSHVLASNDRGLRDRARCLKGLGLFRPEVTRWKDLMEGKPYEAPFKVRASRPALAVG